jgi:protein-disulfide isomerase
MNKLIPVIISGIAVALIVGVGFTSYYAQVVEIQDLRDKSIAMKKADRDILNLDHVSPILGSADAQITIVEFGDYQCEACYHWFHNTRDTLIDNYIETGKAKLIFVDLPFIGRDSKIAAQASYCAEDQGKYWEYHETLYIFQEGENSGWADRDRLNSFAFSLDMNMDEFNDCMDYSKYAKRVQANYDQAVKNGVQGTPTFIIISQDGTTEKFDGPQPYSVFAAIIEPML